MPKPVRRIRRSEAEWSEILGRFAASEMTVREFCHRERLSLSSFQRWRSRLGKARPVETEFVELVPASTVVEPMTSSWSLDIALPNGVQLRFRG
jgi:hypothetical protein